MSRTRKGSKPPGWEWWTNIRDKELLRAEYFESEEEYEAYIQFIKDQKELECQSINHCGS